MVKVSRNENLYYGCDSLHILSFWVLLLLILRFIVEENTYRGKKRRQKLYEDKKKVCFWRRWAEVLKTYNEFMVSESLKTLFLLSMCSKKYFIVEKVLKGSKKSARWEKVFNLWAII